MGRLVAVGGKGLEAAAAEVLSCHGAQSVIFWCVIWLVLGLRKGWDGCGGRGPSEEWLECGVGTRDFGVLVAYKRHDWQQEMECCTGGSDGTLECSGEQSMQSY